MLLKKPVVILIRPAKCGDSFPSHFALMHITPSTKISEKRERLFTIAALVLLPFVYFYPVLLGNVFLAPGDGWEQNLGVRALAGQMIASGQAPLWNPFIFGGMPLAASVYPGCFYPPNWLFAILSPKWAMNLV